MADNQYYYNTAEYKEKLAETMRIKEDWDAKMLSKTQEKLNNYQIEMKKLKKTFTKERCGKENMHFVQSLIERAAFLRSELQFIEDQIQKGSIVELFIQGTQMMIREHPLSRLHVQYLKNYKEVITKLESYGKKEDLSSSSSDKESQNFSNLLSRGTAARSKYVR